MKANREKDVVMGLCQRRLGEYFCCNVGCSLQPQPTWLKFKIHYGINLKAVHDFPYQRWNSAGIKNFQSEPISHPPISHFHCLCRSGGRMWSGNLSGSGLRSTVGLGSCLCAVVRWRGGTTSNFYDFSVGSSYLPYRTSWISCAILDACQSTSFSMLDDHHSNNGVSSWNEICVTKFPCFLSRKQCSQGFSLLGSHRMYNLGPFICKGAF